MDDIKKGSLDLFEKFVKRLEKKGNQTEKLIIGLGFSVLGLLMAFAGANYISTMFGIISLLALGSLITAFLCLVFDTTWDSEFGIALSSISMVVAVPFVPCALKLSDKFAIPLCTGFSCVVIAQTMCSVGSINDENNMKSAAEILSFIVGAGIAMKF